MSRSFRQKADLSAQTYSPCSRSRSRHSVWDPRPPDNVLAVVLTAHPCFVQINPRVSLSMIVKSWAILGTLALSFYIAFFAATNFLVRPTAHSFLFDAVTVATA